MIGIVAGEVIVFVMLFYFIAGLAMLIRAAHKRFMAKVTGEKSKAVLVYEQKLKTWPIWKGVILWPILVHNL